MISCISERTNARKGPGHFILGHSWESPVHWRPCWQMGRYDGGMSGRSLLLLQFFFPLSGIGTRSSLRIRMMEEGVLELLKKKMIYKMVI